MVHLPDGAYIGIASIGVTISPSIFQGLYVFRQPFSPHIREPVTALPFACAQRRANPPAVPSESSWFQAR